MVSLEGADEVENKACMASSPVILEGLAAGLDGSAAVAFRADFTDSNHSIARRVSGGALEEGRTSTEAAVFQLYAHASREYAVTSMNEGAGVLRRYGVLELAS